LYHQIYALSNGGNIMTVTYDDSLSDDVSKVRRFIGDTVEDNGPLPEDANFSDAELTAIIALESTWQRAVGQLLDALSIEWSQHADIAVGPRRQSFAQIAEAYAKRADKWRKDHHIYPAIGVAGIIRDDGYSDDEPSDDADTTSEYARVKIKTWEYPL